MLGRAKYNRLQISSKGGESWEIVDYRNFDLREIFAKLEELGVELDEKVFRSLSEDFDTPEDMAAEFARIVPENGEQIYLLLFELWRRLLEDRETISIFCDELDKLILQYEKRPEGVEDLIQVKLVELVDILDSNADAGNGTRALFKKVSDFSAFNLESFIYGFLLDQHKKENDVLAHELSSAFLPYIKEVRWFELLNLRLMADVKSEEFKHMLIRFEEDLTKSPVFNLDLHFLTFLIEIGRHDAFARTFKRVLGGVKNEQEYLTLAKILFEYYRLNDHEDRLTKLSQHLENWQPQKCITNLEHQILLQDLK